MRIRTLGCAVRRTAQRGWIAWIALGALVATTTLCLFAHHWLTTSERFDIAQLHVSGTKHMAEARVAQAADATLGANVFRTNLHDVERNLATRAWLVNATVDRKLPNALTITVTEREPAAIVELKGLYLVEASGHAFKRAAISRGEGAGLPVITGLSRTEYIVDTAATQATIAAVLRVARRFQERTSIHGPIGEIHIDPRRGLTLITRDTALSVRLGSPFDSDSLTSAGSGSFDAQLTAFNEAWRALSERERAAARVLHLGNKTHPDRVTVRFDSEFATGLASTVYDS